MSSWPCGPGRTGPAPRLDGYGLGVGLASLMRVSFPDLTPRQKTDLFPPAPDVPMPTTLTVDDAGIGEIVMDNPPVNALTVAGWFELAAMLRSAGEDPAVHVVVLRAEGRGFNAGVDIKEMQNTEGFDALIGANRGCFAAFAAVYECAVPVIAAVNGYCLGGGVGLAGNADIVIASNDATFGLPEVDRGGGGGGPPHAPRVPQHPNRGRV